MDFHLERNDMLRIIAVFAVLDLEGKIQDVCSNLDIATRTAKQFDDWHGHGSGKVVERQAIQVDGKTYLLASDFGPEIVLNSSQAAASARLERTTLGFAQQLAFMREQIESGASPLYSVTGGSILYLEGFTAADVVECLTILFERSDQAMFRWLDRQDWTRQTRPTRSDDLRRWLMSRGDRI
jgi:hypothetical protein